MSIKYEHLLGRQFSWTGDHCYALVRNFYLDNYQIELRPYACPHEWWRHGLDIYGQMYHREGFYALDCHPRDYQPGDVIMMSYDAPVANHLGVLLDNGRMLHHMVGGLSTTDPYAGGGFWRSQTVGVLRHRKVTYEPQIKQIDMWSLLPDHVRAQLDHELADRNLDRETLGREGEGGLHLADG